MVNAFNQAVKSSETLTSVGNPQKFSKEINKMLVTDAGITEPYPLSKKISRAFRKISYY